MRYNVQLSGTDYTSFSITTSGSGWKISAATNLTAKTYSFNITAQDSLGNVGTETVTYTVQAAVTTATVYFYGNTAGNTGYITATDPSTALIAFGYDSANQTAYSGTVLDGFMQGNIGSSTIGSVGSLIDSGSLTDLENFDSLGTQSISAQQWIIVFPDTSNLANKASSIFNGTPPATSNTSGRKSVYRVGATAADSGTEPAGIHTLQSIMAVL